MQIFQLGADSAPVHKPPPSCALYCIWTLCLPLMYVCDVAPLFSTNLSHLCLNFLLMVLKQQLGHDWLTGRLAKMEEKRHDLFKKKKKEKSTKKKKRLI